MQLILARNFRITGENISNGTHSYLLQNADKTGSKFIVSAKDNNENDKGKYDHFDNKHIDRFYKNQAGRQGFGAMAFVVPLGNLDKIKQRFEAKHPKLISGYF